MDFQDVVSFHGHVCPGLAMGYRVSLAALRELQFERSGDEEIVAEVENNSCAVDAIQVVTGCTFGKGNFVFKDNGKQVYTFFKRSTAEAVRIAVHWIAPAEERGTSEMWERFRSGDRSPEVVEAVNDSKAVKVQAILSADDARLFAISHPHACLPERAQIHPTLTCASCGEKVMAPKAKKDKAGHVLCIPCCKKEQGLKD